MNEKTFAEFLKIENPETYEVYGKAAQALDEHIARYIENDRIEKFMKPYIGAAEIDNMSVRELFAKKGLNEEHLNQLESFAKKIDKNPRVAPSGIIKNYPVPRNPK